MSPCGLTLAANQTLEVLERTFVFYGCNPDPCSIDIPVDYDLGLHIASVFIILFCSTLGALIPLISKASASWGNPKYFIALGKHIGTGIVLACALIHLLQPASQSLTSLCVPWEFNTGYNAYAFLYCLLVMIIFHFIEQCVRFKLMPPGQQSSTSAEMMASRKIGEINGTDNKNSENLDDTTSVTPSRLSFEQPMQAIMIEVGLTIHSYFIGLTTGVADITVLHYLLVALCFHQLFEGIALGARLADAEFSTPMAILLLCIFATSAPIGLAIGIAVTQVMNPNGITFLLVQGTFDGCCSGLLLYAGMQLLLIDFPNDIRQFCAGEKPVRHFLGLFIALWCGAGFMAYLGDRKSVV